MEYTKKEAKAYARQNMHGLWGSIPYPFRQDHELDENGLLSDLGYYIDTIKIDGFYMGGIINEFWTLSVEERMRAQELLIGEARGKVLTVTMTGHTSVKMSIELSRHAERVGADFIALMNPYYAASKPENSYEYFRAIASEVDVGILDPQLADGRLSALARAGSAPGRDRQHLRDQERHVDRTHQ